jgi:hypothetical protein
MAKVVVTSVFCLPSSGGPHAARKSSIVTFRRESHLHWLLQKTSECVLFLCTALYEVLKCHIDRL